MKSIVILGRSGYKDEDRVIGKLTLCNELLNTRGSEVREALEKMCEKLNIQVHQIVVRCDCQTELI